MAIAVDSGTASRTRFLREVPNSGVSKEAIEEFCRSRGVTKLCAFGYLLDDEFTLDVELGFVVWFESEDLIELGNMAIMEDDLAEMFGREVHLLTMDAVTQDYNRKTGRTEPILAGLEKIYEAQ